MQQVHWGVIGAGGIASRRTLPEAIYGAKSARFVALMDAREESAREASTRFDIPNVHPTLDALLADPGVDAVYIATPTAAHLPQIMASAAAGKHVLVERPITLTSAEAKQAIEACRRSGVLLGCACRARFHPLHLAARQMRERGDLGQIVAGRAHVSSWCPPDPGVWRQRQRSAGGGSLMHLGGDCIDLLEFITGSRVLLVYALNQSLVHDYALEDTSTVVLRMESGAQMVVASFFSIPDAAGTSLLEIYGTRGALRGRGTIGETPGGSIQAILADQGERDAAQGDPSPARTIDLKGPPVDLYAAQIEQFSRAILDGGEPAVTGEEALWNLQVIEACYRSTKANCEMPVRR